LCGIVGIGCLTPGGLWYTQEQMFKQLLIADSLRGIDGAGIVRIKKDGTPDWRKLRGSGFDLLRADGVNTWLGKATPDCDKILIGHNRYASVGNKTTNNAHPFEHSHITLVHNGYVSNLSAFGKKANKFDVDSNGLTFAIAKHGILPVLEKLRGAYSIVYFDKDLKTLNFARNADRPMFIGFEPDKKMLIFGSEKPMLDWIVDRTKQQTDYPEIKELPIHTLASLTLEGELTFAEYTAPAPYVYQVPSQWQEELEYTWEQNPDSKVWERVKVDTTVTDTTPTTTPRSTAVTVAQNVTRLYRNRAGTKAFDFPDQLYGFKQGDKIQFVAMEKHRASDKQDQWRVDGSHPQFEKLEIRLWVKGEKTADTLIDTATMVEATVRSLKRESNDKPIIFVSDPNPIFTNASPDKVDITKATLLMLPDSTTKH